MAERKPIPPLTDAEEAEIAAQIAADPDDFTPTVEEAATARPFAEALPELAAGIRRRRGRPPVGKPRQLVSLRLDPDVLEKFRSTGPGWQSRINAILKQAKI
jgi:uncharacterized protein (DUF4415 family)